jgi:hypothetical protein
MSTAQYLDDLERRSLIALAAATPDLAYIFRHVLAQDAVYASLLWTILAAQLELAARQGKIAEADTLRPVLRTLLHQLADAAGSPERRAGFLAAPAVQAALRL